MLRQTPKLSTRYESVFSYNVSRPYPFPWFTWVVAIGGIIVTVLFSILNYATNAFNLVSLYTTNPNGTAAETHWYDRQPFSLAQKPQSACQPQDVRVNTQLFSTNLGFTYTLINVTTLDSQNETTIQPSLTYLNNTLTQCAVKSVGFVAKNGNKLGNYPGWSWSSAFSIITTCKVPNGDSQATITLGAQWSPGEDVAADEELNPDYFVRRDRKNGANLWWAQELLFGASWKAMEVFAAHSAEAPAVHNTISTFVVSLWPRSNVSLSSIDFLRTNCRYYTGDGVLYAPSNDSVQAACNLPLGSRLDTLIKTLYSTVLADLGATESPNILANATLLQGVLDELGDKRLYSGTNANVSWSRYESTTGSLAVKSATFYMQYLCQVPVRKSVGSLLIALFIADIVLLRALWTVFTFGTSLNLTRTDKFAHYCEGCVKAQQGALMAHSPDPDYTPESAAPSTYSFRIPRKPASSAYEFLPPLSSTSRRHKDQDSLS